MDPSMLFLEALRRGNIIEVARWLDNDPTLLRRADDRGDGAVAWAAAAGRLDVVVLLEQRGANIHFEGRDGRTALYYAGAANHEDVVGFLLSKGAEVNITDRHGMTPLLGPCVKGHVGVVQMLVQHMQGQGLDATDRYGNTPLHLAALGGHEKVVDFLLSQGAQANLTDRRGMTPLMGACSTGHVGVVQMLLHQTEGQGLEAMDLEARTALHLAAEEGHADVVAVLLSQGAQANMSAQDGKTPLLVACAEGHLGVVQMLLQHVEGRALDVPDHYGDTALHLAATEGYGEVIRALLLAGADPSMTDNKGRMPRVIWRMDEERRAQEDVFQWWEGQLQRRYLLYRARCLHDTYMTLRDTPAAPVPAYLQKRVAAGHALPRMETSPQPPLSEVGTTGQGGALSEAAYKDEEVRAVLHYAVLQLNEQLFTELMEGFHAPK